VTLQLSSGLVQITQPGGGTQMRRRSRRTRALHVVAFRSPCSGSWANSGHLPLTGKIGEVALVVVGGRAPERVEKLVEPLCLRVDRRPIDLVDENNRPQGRLCSRGLAAAHRKAGSGQSGPLVGIRRFTKKQGPYSPCRKREPLQLFTPPESFPGDWGTRGIFSFIIF